ALVGRNAQHNRDGRGDDPRAGLAPELAHAVAPQLLVHFLDQHIAGHENLQPGVKNRAQHSVRPGGLQMRRYCRETEFGSVSLMAEKAAPGTVSGSVNRDNCRVEAVTRRHCPPRPSPPARRCSIACSGPTMATKTAFSSPTPAVSRRFSRIGTPRLPIPGRA